MTWVLGVNIGHQSGATLVREGKVFVSINLERITRIKNDNGYPSPEENNWDYSLIEFPWKAMDYCLDYANIQKMDLDRIVWNGIGLTPDQQISVDGFLVQKLKKNGYNLPNDRLNYCTHHLAHAYSTHYSSGFDESIILVADNAGEMNYKQTVDDFVENKIAHTQKTRLGECVEATSIYEVKKGVFKRIYSRYKAAYSYFNTVGKHKDGSGFSTRYRLGKSLGEWYYDNCIHIGLTGDDAGKLMGLAPFGDEDKVKQKYKEPMVYIDKDPKAGEYLIRAHEHLPYEEQEELDEMYINTPIPSYMSDKIYENDFQSQANHALFVQNQFERVVEFLAKKCSMISDVKNFCVAGGSFLNSVANQKIIDLDIFDNHFFVPAADDSGISLGCAFYGYFNFHSKKGIFNLSNREESAFMGKKYNEKEILGALKEYS